MRLLLYSAPQLDAPKKTATAQTKTGEREKMSAIGNIISAPFRLIAKVGKVLLYLLLAAAIIVAAVNAFVWVTTKENIKTTEADLKGYTANAIVVPGASVLEDGTPSTILKDRLDTAITLYNAGAARVILVSGASSTQGYCESESMANYLIDQGIPASRIVKDYEGNSTYATMYRAKNSFGYTDVIIASQGYHLPRCVFCAQGVGLTARGVDSAQGHTYNDQLYYDVREVFSNMKAAFDVWMKTPAEDTALTQQYVAKFGATSAN